MEKEQKKQFVTIAQHILDIARSIKKETNCTQIEATTMATALFAECQQDARMKHIESLFIRLATGGEVGGQSNTGIVTP